MYTNYFSLAEAPFTIAPNPDFLFMSERHKEALNHLSHGLGDIGGFVLLTGEVGTGKTTICRKVMEQLPKNTEAAFILNPTLSNLELLESLCDKLTIDYDTSNASIKYFTDKIHHKLLSNFESGVNTLLVVDEAQHLQPEVLEQLRLLTNLETNTKKLLQVILVGQPELQQLLQRRDLRQLAQRITARYHLMPLSLKEVKAYLQHRLSVAQCHRMLFDTSAIKLLHKISKGVPRVINLLAERSLLRAYDVNASVVSSKQVKLAAKDALGEEIFAELSWRKRYAQSLMLALIMVSMIVIGVYVGNVLFQKNETKNVPFVNEAELSDTSDAKNVISQEAEAVENTNKQSNKELEEKLAKLQLALDKVVENQETALSVKNKEALSFEQIPEVLGQEEQPIVVGYVPENRNDDFTNTNITVKKEDGVSDDLLARFQHAIEETNNDEQVDEKTDVKTDELIAGAESDADNITPITQMPVWLQEELPNITFNLHIYASDNQGWVRVNGEDKYQGDLINQTITIDKILPQHVILSYKGQQFSMQALSSW